MSEQKHNYDIEIIKKGVNEPNRKSINKIARENGWPEVLTHDWVNRHFKRTVDFIPKK